MMSEQHDMSELTDAQLRSMLAGAQILAKRAGELVKAAKGEYERRMEGSSEPETCMFAGRKAAQVRVTRGAQGKYTVTDPVAYANILRDIDAKVPGGDNAWKTVRYPREEATSGKYLDALIEAHGGEIPDGVEYKPGRAGGVTITLEKGIVDTAFSIEAFGELLQITEGEDK